MATSPSKKKPEAKKAPVAPAKKMRPEDTMSEKGLLPSRCRKRK
jgi:hypothetical protein